MKMNRSFIFLLATIAILSCDKDDGSVPGTVVPARLLSEVAVEDDAELKSYLNSHFYNYEQFENPPAGFDFKIVLDTIAGDNLDKTPLMNFVQIQVIRVASSAFGRDDNEEVDHTLYYLSARDGVEGQSPTFADNTVLQYEGSLLDGTKFDASTTPVNQYLPGTIRGYSNGVEKFNTGSAPIENGDGTLSFDNYGIGAIFIPSGLGYFAGSPAGANIPAYAPLIFKVDVLSFLADTDFDQDGIPSILEDLDNDGNVNNDNTNSDTEQVFLPNHRDADDDGDGVLTIDEIDLDDEGNFVGFRDTDGDGISDHLDNDN